MSAVINAIGQPIGTVWHDSTEAEADANVTPVDYRFEDGDVRRYGADPTGAEDSAEAFQNSALVAAQKRNHGGVVRMPAGSYKVLTRIEAPGRILFVGDGYHSTRINLGTGVSGFLFSNSVATGEIEGGGIIDCSISHDTCAVVVEFFNYWGGRIERVFFSDGTHDGISYTERIIKGSGQSFELKLLYNRLLGAELYGIDLVDDCNSCIVEGNDLALADGCTALRLQNLSDAVLDKNRYEYAGSDAGTKIEIDTALNTVIRASHIEAASSGYCIVQKGGSFGTKLTDNAFSVSGTAAVLDLQGGDYFASNNTGFATRNKGTSTIASGSTSIAVAHGLAITPSLGDFSITPSANTTTDPGNLWISSIGATNFTVNCRTNPGVGGMAFGWSVNCAGG